jgi:hypothetical protein
MSIIPERAVPAASGATTRAMLGWIALVVAAIAAGALATRPVMLHMIDRTALRNGPWRTSVTTGSADAGLYERAAVAIAGLYALAPEETIYYTAFTDSAGAALDGRCDYVVAGKPVPARWWSLTMYGADSYLVRNFANLYSRHAGNLDFAADGAYRVEVSANERGQNWLPAPVEGAFSITLRLYNPAPVVYRNLSGIELPTIVRESCR